MRRSSLAPLVTLLAACSGPPSAACGPGTHLDVDGYCVVTDGECPEGSVEMDGVCVSERTVVGPGECGEGTYLDEESLRCVSAVRCAEGEIVHEGVCLDQDTIDAASADCVESGEQDDRRYGGVPTPCAAPPVIGESVIIAGDIAPTEWDDEGDRIHDWDEWTLDIERGDVVVVSSTQLGVSPLGVGLDCAGTSAGGRFGIELRETFEFAAAEGPCVLRVSGSASATPEATPYLVVVTRRAMPEPREITVGERVSWNQDALDGSLFRVIGSGTVHALVMPDEVGRWLRRVESGVPALGEVTAGNGSLVVGETPTFFLTAYDLPADDPGFELEVVEVSPVPLGSATPDATTERPFTLPPETIGYVTIEVPVGQVLEELSSAHHLWASAFSGRDGSRLLPGWLNVDQTEPVIVSLTNGQPTTANETLSIRMQTPVDLGSLRSSGAPITSAPLTLVSGVRYYKVYLEDSMSLRVTSDSASGTAMRMRVLGRLRDRDGGSWTDGSTPIELTARAPEPGWVVVEVGPATAAPLVGATVRVEPL